MKKAITILAICSLLLTACGQIDDTESKAETTTAIVSESTSDEDTAETSSAKGEKDTSEATTTTRKSSQTVSSSSKPTGTTVTTTKKTGSSNVNGNSNQVQNYNGQENNYQPEQNNQQQPDNSPSDNDQSNNGAQQNDQPTDNKPQNNNPSPPVTTAKPVVTNKPTTTTPKPQNTEPQTEPPAPEPTEEERYMDIGRNLLHDGSDYSKAEAVYNWMTENGSGTCVNYSYKTYLICQGIGLDCYACWTDSGIYGHVANIVKVDGIWYVLDTQAGAFLDYNYGFTEVVDIDENHIADGSMISDYSYEELHE